MVKGTIQREVGTRLGDLKNRLGELMKDMSEEEKIALFPDVLEMVLNACEEFVSMQRLRHGIIDIRPADIRRFRTEETSPSVSSSPSGT